ncbi:MAG: hypothetical protein Q9220_003322 [cf. Caloplaca sp. 1 TL-2023]
MTTNLSRAVYRFLSSSPFQTSTIVNLPPAFLLPLRAHLSTISHTTDPEPQPSDYTTTSAPPPSSKFHQAPPLQQPSTSPSEPLHPSNSTITPTLSQNNTPSVLPLLASQPPHYITAHIHARPYLLTTGDTLRLPFRMPSAPLGTILRLNRASMIGSRDYTFRGSPWVDEKCFVCRARVVGVETEPMRFKEKTKRRQRRVKVVRSKMRFTVLRIVEVGVSVPDEEVGGGAEDGTME